MDTGIFQYIGATISNATDAFITPAAQNLMNELQGFTIAAVALYIFLMGAAMLFGTVQSATSRFLIQCFRLVFVTAIALSISHYTDYVITGFTALERGLAAAMNISSGNSNTLYQTLDQTLGQGVELMNLCFRHADDAGWNLGSALGWICAGSAVAAGITIVCVLGGAAIILAKLALAILFALGPFFILLLCFPVTSRYFDSWFAQVMNYTLLSVIISVILSFAMAAIGAFMNAADLSGAGQVNALMVAIEIAALSLVLVFLIYQAYGMAASLAGGLSMAAMTAAHLIAPINTAARMLNPSSTRRDLQSGMMVSGSRADHLIAGNTAFNPAYTQQALKNIGRNYGRWQGGAVRPVEKKAGVR